MNKSHLLNTACILIAILPLHSNAATFNIDSMNITGGGFDIDISDGTITINPFTTFGPNTDLVSGYIGNGGTGLLPDTPDPDSIIGVQFAGLPVNAYTAASNLGDTSTAIDTQTGGLIPTGTLDDIAGTITMDLSSWFMNWNDTDIQAGTGKADTSTSDFATGIWDPVSGAYSLSWQSITGAGPKASTLTYITLEGIASPVPIPTTIWLFGSGLLGLVGIARQKTYALKPRVYLSGS